MDKGSIHRETLKDYVAGAILANAPMWILTYALLKFELRKSPFTSAIILNLSTMACGALAGSLVARKTGLDARRVGIVVGVLSYIFFALFLTLIGFRGEMIEETSSLTGFFIGSAIGSKLWENRRSNLNS